MLKILITGGAGNVGGSLAKRLVTNPENFVVVVDDLSTGNLKKLPDADKYANFKFIKSDVNSFDDISSVVLRYGFDFIFHYAAVVGVKRTLDNPVKVLRDIQGIQNILLLAKNTGVKRVFYSSSSEVYGEPVEFPQNEDTTPLNSKLPYAIVKNVGEAFLKSYKKEYNLDYTIFRFFNTYGPDQSPDFVISKFIDAALENRPITIYGDGMQTRTFCYVDDNIEATTNAMYNDLFVNEVVNIGSDKELTILELARLVIKETDSSSEIIFLPPLEEGDMTRRKPDIRKMNQLLKRNMTSIEEGIRKIIKLRLINKVL
ncbi:MAG: NAD-dependent epimerase/dehydratase family protein [Chitinophagaceae bacterium]|nr:NAD-dependent epimerase/dehydratase family protein [Chitinophagaceae bacterium]